MKLNEAETAVLLQQMEHPPVLREASSALEAVCDGRPLTVAQTQTLFRLRNAARANPLETKQVIHEDR